MKTDGNTILITGGATGIGFALAEAFVNAGNEVIICGRRQNKLEEAQSQLPAIQIKACDLSKAEEREELFEWTKSSFPTLNILVNNAGIQRMVDFKKGIADLLHGENEIEVNLVAPIHLSAYFIPLLTQQEESAIINVSSGLGFVPLAIMPVYCSTKAALHIFSMTLRHQLRNTSTKVFEVIPPTTDTELDHGARDRRGQTDRGIPPSEVADATLSGLANDEFEIAVGMAEGLRTASRENLEETFQRMNSWSS